MSRRPREHGALPRLSPPFGWYSLNMLDPPPHHIVLQLGHTEGGRVMRWLDGHPDAAIARERLREAVRSMHRTVMLGP